MNSTAAASLANAGMTEREAERKAQTFEALGRQLPSSHSTEWMRWFVPGRIEVLGKHTDYAGGRSLLCTAERGFCVAAVERKDSVVRVSDVVRRQSLEFSISPDLVIPNSGWKVFPMVVARRLARNFPGALRGSEIALSSDLPSAAGMSSSSALVVAIFTVLSAVSRLSERPEFRAEIRSVEDLAGYLGCIENGQSYRSLTGDSGVGTFGGSEDHTAILTSQPGHLKQYAFCPVRLEDTVQLPTDCVFVIAVSGVVADKTGSARAHYNRASVATKTILEVWRAANGSNEQTLAEMAASSDVSTQRVCDVLRQVSAGAESQWLCNRFEQFWLESEVIIPRAFDALAKGDLRAFGALVDQSQAAAEALLRNQVPETIWLTRQARSLGAHAASAFGAGFGGSVWALVSRKEAARFADCWREAYQRNHPATSAAEFFVTAAGPPLIRL
jgi:galactokinase